MARNRAGLKIRVGLFIIVSLVILGVIIFLMGKERRLFENRIPFEIQFSRTNGLREGAPISLTGVTVGSVESISFPADVGKSYVVVRIKVVGEVAPRIREDMVARIRTQGLLGDKFIELSGGSMRSEPVSPGGRIASIDPIDYEGLLGERGDVIQNFTEVASSLKNILKSIEKGDGPLGELVAPDRKGRWAETAENLRTASASLKSILSSVERGEGVIGKLVRGGPAEQAMVEDLQAGLRQFRTASESLRQIAEKVARGEGTLGTLIHDPDTGREVLASLRRSTANLERITYELRYGDGILKRLMTDRRYGERVLANLERTSQDLAEITGKVERGEGTLGALVNDAQLYNEAKEVIATAKGSWLFSVSRFFRNLFSSADEPAAGKAPGTSQEAAD
ncbi:MAG: MCE family protein [Deltaproteobacteria bacterium]|nr:MCE family protein [Deltaproteobacteria bacterium]